MSKKKNFLIRYNFEMFMHGYLAYHLLGYIFLYNTIIFVFISFVA